MTDTKIKIVMSLSNTPSRGNLGTATIGDKLEGYVNEAIEKLERSGREILNVSISMAADDQGITNSMTAAILHRGGSEQS